MHFLDLGNQSVEKQSIQHCKSNLYNVVILLRLAAQQSVLCEAALNMPHSISKHFLATHHCIAVSHKVLFRVPGLVFFC